jgi:starch phosphorylase
LWRGALLEKLGENPTVWHMNEGHSAFLTLERVHGLVKKGMSFAMQQRK